MFIWPIYWHVTWRKFWNQFNMVFFVSEVLLIKALNLQCTCLNKRLKWQTEWFARCECTASCFHIYCRGNLPNEFNVKVYMPVVFNNLRKAFGISNDDYTVFLSHFFKCFFCCSRMVYNSLVSLMMTMMMIMNCFLVWLTGERHLALFPAGTIVRDPHHRESPTRREQDLNLRRAWVQAQLNEAVQ